jgi:hypothetical protein
MVGTPTHATTAYTLACSRERSRRAADLAPARITTDAEGRRSAPSGFSPPPPPATCRSHPLPLWATAEVGCGGILTTIAKGSLKQVTGRAQN